MAADPLDRSVLVTQVGQALKKRGFPVVKLDLETALSAPTIITTTDGASTLELEIIDPEWLLITSGFLDSDDNRKLDTFDLNYPAETNYWWRLTQVQASTSGGANVTLTFEARVVGYLRSRKGQRSVSRAQMTRARFIKSLSDEVKAGGGIHFRAAKGVIDKKQRIEKDKDVPKAEERADSKDRGLNRDEEYVIWGFDGGEHKLTKAEIANAETAMDVAHSHDAGPKATKALIEACIVEAPFFSNPTGGDATSSGILQLLATTRPDLNHRDVAAVCSAFLKDGFWGKGGAIELAKNNPSMSAGWVAQQTQGSAHPDRYDAVSAGAEKIISAYGGASSGSGSGADTVAVSYQYTRGTQDDPREDSWAAMTRLAEEVNWYLFAVANRLYYFSGPDLLAQKPHATINRTDDGVVDLNMTWNSTSASVSEVTLDLICDPLAFHAGVVIQLRGCGPADTRWIVTETQRNPYEAITTLTLSQPELPDAEPAAEQRTVSDDEESSGGTSGGGKSIKDAIKGSPVPGQRPQGSTHQTAGLPGYPAYDYMAPAGTPCVAPVDGKIDRISGKSPKAGGPPGGALGYSIYMSGGGKSYFMTHLDKVLVKAGDSVDQGQQIAEVADGPRSWSSPHVHMGVKG